MIAWHMEKNKEDGNTKRNQIAIISDEKVRRFLNVKNPKILVYL